MVLLDRLIPCGSKGFLVAALPGMTVGPECVMPNEERYLRCEKFYRLPLASGAGWELIPRPLLLRREGGKVMGGIKFYWFYWIG